MGTFEIVRGDITRLDIECIVNAANNTLLGGGGVDGAIHAAAGPGLLEECRNLGGCNTGEAKITRGYNLPAKWVIHTVGPIWKGGTHGEDELLARCYTNSLILAARNGIKALAFPSISTGAYRFPVRRAAGIAIREITHFLDSDARLENVFMVCFNDAVMEEYVKALNNKKMIKVGARRPPLFMIYYGPVTVHVVSAVQCTKYAFP